MTTVAFGDDNDHAVVFYDRRTLVCIVVANQQTHIQDAIAVVNSLKVASCLIIAPKGTEFHLANIEMIESVEVYEYVK